MIDKSFDEILRQIESGVNRAQLWLDISDKKDSKKVKHSIEVLEGMLETILWDIKTLKRKM